MTADKEYCISSFLSYRRIVDESKTFREGIIPKFQPLPKSRTKIHSSRELFAALKNSVAKATADGKAALALSGGIDSAILAKLMPAGSTAYTFKCVVPGKKVTDETGRAAQYAAACGLKHKVVEIYWEDMEKYAPMLMKHKGAPIHSIEVQIYKAALVAKRDGFSRMIYGESADCVFGGLSGLLSKKWLVGDFIERYFYVRPWKAVKLPELVLDPVLRHEKDGFVDPHEFLSAEFYPESVRSYLNASETAGLGIAVPYAECIMDVPLDYPRVRRGENKYLVREVFRNLYEGFDIPPKIPMPRPMNEWLSGWSGPVREEFWPHCAADMTGDQKWLLWSLERFLDVTE